MTVAGLAASFWLGELAHSLAAFLDPSDLHIHLPGSGGFCDVQTVRLRPWHQGTFFIHPGTIGVAGDMQRRGKLDCRHQLSFRTLDSLRSRDVICPIVARLDIIINVVQQQFSLHDIP